MPSQLPPAGPPEVLSDRLGYLLKHVQQRFAEVSVAALAPYGVTGRELAVLLVLAGREPASQQEAAGRLGIDRTTMVALLDGLETKGLVGRRPDPADRRRNVVGLTAAGEQTVAAGAAASRAAEREFLAPLGSAGPAFREALARLLRPAD